MCLAPGPELQLRHERLAIHGSQATQCGLEPLKGLFFDLFCNLSKSDQHRFVLRRVPHPWRLRMGLGVSA
jgi:hypothetical protein